MGVYLGCYFLGPKFGELNFLGQLFAQIFFWVHEYLHYFVGLNDLLKVRKSRKPYLSKKI